MFNSNAEKLTKVILAVFRLNGILTEWGDRFVSSEGLTSTRWRILGAVALAQKPLTAPQIAHTMGLTRQGVRKQLNVLMECGLIRVLDNPLHKRSHLYNLTESGRSLFDKIEECWQFQAEKMAKKHNTKELEIVVNVLNSLSAMPEVSRPEEDL